MFRPTVAARAVAPLRASTRPVARQIAAPRFRTFATGTVPPATPPPNNSGGASQGTHTAIILAAIAGLAGGIYYMVKPVADVAIAANSAIKTAQGGASELGDGAAQLAKAFLPPGAFQLFSAVANQNGFLSNLKDKDLQGVIDEVKKVGGEDVKRITEKVEKKIKEAKGNVKDVDWKALAQELKEELPKDKQHMVDMLIGKIPDKEDFEKMINKAKEAGAEQFKAAEKAASKIMAQVDKARKEGKGQADAFLSGLKSAAPGDVDELIKQLKGAAEKAGLPADTIESWVKSKADEKNLDVEEISKQLEDKLRTAAKFLPNDPQDVIKQVESISPSVAKLLQQAMEQAEVIKKK